MELDEFPEPGISPHKDNKLDITHTHINLCSTFSLSKPPRSKITLASGCIWWFSWSRPDPLSLPIVFGSKRLIRQGYTILYRSRIAPKTSLQSSWPSLISPSFSANRRWPCHHSQVPSLISYRCWPLIGSSMSWTCQIISRHISPRRPKACIWCSWNVPSRVLVE